ncbi:hypothetical protein LLE81_05120, partial [Staphylococcus epidermidis]|nr:hypothetical protein [Staphylococcus epidermidis]
TNRNCYDLRIILNEAHAVVNINENYFKLKKKGFNGFSFTFLKKTSKIFASNCNYLKVKSR